MSKGQVGGGAVSRPERHAGLLPRMKITPLQHFPPLAETHLPTFTLLLLERELAVAVVYDYVNYFKLITERLK